MRRPYRRPWPAVTYAEHPWVIPIAIHDVGDMAERRAGVDGAYRAKYGRYAGTSVDRMVTADAAASTLRLIPDREPRRDP